MAAITLWTVVLGLAGQLELLRSELMGRSEGGPEPASTLYRSIGTIVPEASAAGGR